MGDTVRFEHFEVLRRDDGSLFELGRGAMGITYKAFDTNLRCFVALKVINSAYLNSEVARQRFLREARAAAALRHPNVATVFHLGSEDDNYFYAMEFVDGETVESFMKREGAVPTPMALEIAIQVARALGAADKQGLVHRDIKPSNLMLMREDEQDFTVKVIDFGLAKSSNKEEDTATLTAGGFLGTPHFASPEQLEERNIDVRSDIYSLGVTLWYMLAGRTPFSGSLAQVMSQHLHRQPPFENLEGQPPEVVTLLRRMMAKDPADRPQTPSLLRREAEECLEKCRVSMSSASPAATVEGDAFETAVLPEPIADEPTELSSGQILAARYRLLDEMTASDHGRVFRAERLEDGVVVAILLLHSEKLATSEAFTQLESEIDSLQRLRAPSLQKILSLERTEGQSFLSLEWIEGPVLLDVLRARRFLSLPETIRVLAPMAQAFDELLAASLSCPDIAVHEVVLPGGDPAQPITSWPACEPRFLPLSQLGSTSLPADATMVASAFALMKGSGAFAGNPASAYVYAISSLAFEMLGGVKRGTATGGYVPIPGLSEEGNAILRRALNPPQGFSTATEFVQALAAAKAGSLAAPSLPPVASVAPPPPLPPASVAPPSPPPLPPRKKSPLVPLLAASGGALLVIAVLGWWLSSRGSPSAPKESSTPTPAPIARVESTPTPTPEPPSPTPTPANQPYLDAVAAAEQLQQRDDFAGALNAWADIAQQFPAETKSIEQLEMIAAGLRRSGRLTPANFSSLRPALERAAALQSVSAQMLLGESLRTSEPTEALKWFREAGGRGQSEAMVYAGQMLASGKGVDAPDLTEAVSWFSKAAQAGDPAGMYLLGECTLYGKGVARDPRRAVELFTAASALNQPRAMSVLGDIYSRGIPDVIESNPEEAFRLLSKATSLGFLDAQGNLGVLYIKGQGTPKDDAKAAELFKDGAEKGNPLCMNFYATCLEGGVGVAQDLAAARTWYVKAARGGNKLAQEWCRKHNVTP